jgi:hypothetical protein
MSERDDGQDPSRPPECEPFATPRPPLPPLPPRRPVSPSIEAALSLNPTLAPALAGEPVEADAALPQLAHDLFPEQTVDPTTLALVTQPPAPTSSALEAEHAKREALLDERCRTLLGLSLTGLRAAGKGVIDVNDDIDAALARVDRATERARRYRRAMGGGTYERLAHALETRVAAEDWAQIQELRKLRLESVAATVRYLVRAGLILAQERTRRLELNIERQVLAKLAADPQDPVVRGNPTKPAPSAQTLVANRVKAAVRDEALPPPKVTPPAGPGRRNPFEGLY